MDMDTILFGLGFLFVLLVLAMLFLAALLAAPRWLLIVALIVASLGWSGAFGAETVKGAVDPQRVWFARPGALPKGAVVVVREDCLALVVITRSEMPRAHFTHCARI